MLDQNRTPRRELAEDVETIFDAIGGAGAISIRFLENLIFGYFFKNLPNTKFSLFQANAT